MPEMTAPTFKELLDDPIIVAVMDRDGVSRDDLWTLMASMRDRLQPAPKKIAA